LLGVKKKYETIEKKAIFAGIITGSDTRCTLPETRRAKTVPGNNNT
jgi:hypothetical protein